MNETGRTIIIAGVVLIVVGIALSLLGKVPGVGKLPGDILIKKENFTFYAPIATTLIISLILTVLINLFTRFRK